MKKSLGKLTPLLVAANYFGSALEQQATEPASPPISIDQKQSDSLRWTGPDGIAYVLKSVPPPPAPGSEKDKADLEAVLKAQAARTPGQIKEAQADQKLTIERLTGMLGPDFNAKNYPLTFDLLNGVLQDESSLGSQLRARYKRHRPYEDHPEVKPLYTVDDYGYPSGTVSGARVLLQVLVVLFPDKIPDLLDREAKFAQSGVDAGVIYPSDLVAGRALAQSLQFVIQDTPDFQRALLQARAEVAAKTKK